MNKNVLRNVNTLVLLPAMILTLAQGYLGLPSSRNLNVAATRPPITIEVPTPATEKSYLFGELWDQYFLAQNGPDSQKGKVTDFEEYCTYYGGPAGCGFNENDPNFDSKFHGHINGYRVVLENGKWVYYEKSTPTPSTPVPFNTPTP